MRVGSWLLGWCGVLVVGTAVLGAACGGGGDELGPVDVGGGGTGGTGGGLPDGQAGTDASAGRGGTDGGAGRDGAAGTGGQPGDAGEEVAVCPTMTFLRPTNGATLTNADDRNRNNCADGFQYDVEVSTNASNGESAKLYGNSVLLGTTTVSGGRAVFADLTLDSNGATTLKVQIGPQDCVASADVTVSCDTAACSISLTKPVISTTHPALNGVAVADGGDRVSAPANPYQTAFEVQSNAGSGTTATLTVDGQPQAASTQIDGAGKGVFAAVTLVPDGTHRVQAVCRKQTGMTGMSAEGFYLVDTTPPDLTVAGVTAGRTISFGDDVDPGLDDIQFDVCGTTTASDASDLPVSLGNARNNLCVKVGSGQPACQPVQTNVSSVKTACVRLDCNIVGSAPQDIVVTLRDWAGNPAVFTAAGVHCSTTAPTITIVDPVAYDSHSGTPFILNASQDKGGASGLQYTVVACSNAPVGSDAKLMQKATGAGTFLQIGSTVKLAVAQAGDNCPGGTPNVAKFALVTLAESEEKADATLLNTTQLRVDVTVGATTFLSGVTDEWVDSTKPSPYVVNIYDPTDASHNTLIGCNSVIHATTDQTTTVRGGCDVMIPIAARVEHQASPADTTGTVVASGIVPIPNAVFKTGTNNLKIVGTEPSGNVGESAVCPVMVGNPPLLQFVSPTNSTVFNLSSTDVDPVAPDFQTDVTLTTDDNTDQVSLTVAGVAAGTVSPSGGNVLFPSITIPEGDAVQIQATQTAVGGQATATVTVRVDRHAPTAATTPAAIVADRRAATATLTFNAPSDYDPVTPGTRAAGSYEIRYLVAPAAADCTTVMTESSFGSGTAVNPGGVPAAPGTSDTRTVSGLVTGKSYCCGLRAKDAAQNVGPVVAFPIVEPAWLSTSIAPPSGASNFGGGVLGDIDIDQDGYYDVLVGGDPNSVWIYYGSASGLEAQPKVRIVGPAGGLFGVGIADLGNFDDSKETPKPLPEFAVSAMILNSQGAVYVFSLPASLHNAPTMTTIQINADGTPVSGALGAHFLLIPDGSASFNNSFFGSKVVNVGDFDGDTIPDVVVGAYGYGGNLGRAFLFRGRSAASLITLVAATQCDVEFTTSATGSTFGLAIAPLGKSGVPSAGGGAGGVAFGVNTAGGGTAGAVYAVPGRDTGTIGQHLVRDVATAAGASATGNAGDYFGGTVYFAGDVDGDGYDDLLGGSYDPNVGYVNAYIIYGGSSWGARVKVTNDVGVPGDSFPRYGALLSLGNTAAAQLNADSKADVVFNTYRSSGVATQTVWVVNGGTKLSGSATISSIGVRPPLPSDTKRGWPVSFTPSIQPPGDSWPDILVGDREAVGGGRVLVIY